MARERAATVSARAETVRTPVRALAQAVHTRLVWAEPWLSRTVPVMLVLFIAVLADCVVRYAHQASESAVADAADDLDLVSTLLTNDLNRQLAANPAEPAHLLLARAVPGRMLARGRQIIVTDARGIIAGALPSDDAPAGALSAYLGAARAPVMRGERNGVSRSVLASGREALVISRPLQDPLGQVTFVQTVDGALEACADWWWHWSLYLLIAGGVVVSLAGIYLWQAMRARLADMDCDRVRARIDTALDSGGCGLWDWDIARGCLYWSDSMYRMLGLPPGNRPLPVAEVEAMIHPDDPPLASLLRPAGTSAVHAVDHAFRLRNADGDWMWVRARAQLAHRQAGQPHLIGIAVDVTAEKRLAEATATADARLRDAVEAISEAFVLWDADNRLVICNSKFQRFHNLPPEAVAVGTPYRDIVARGDAPAVQNQITLAERPKAEGRTYKVQLADERWLQISERRTRDGGYVSVGTDITALKFHESRLMDSERRLMASVADLKRHRQTLETQAQQLAELAEKYLEQKAEAECADRAKSDFLANMSHQLWTPLTHIIGFAQMMEDRAFGRLDSPKYQAYPAHIRRSGEYLRDVVADVLEMTRLDRGDVRLAKRVLELDQAAARAVAKVADAAAAKNIALDASLPPAHKLHGDPWAVEKMLSQLLDNAVKYTPVGGRIIVCARAVGSAVNIFVADNGIGIPPDALSRLGRPFEQFADVLDNGMRGSGLGLAIACSLAQMHGGSIRIRSRQGMGTVVMLHLPAAKCAVLETRGLEAA